MIAIPRCRRFASLFLLATGLLSACTGEKPATPPPAPPPAPDQAAAMVADPAAAEALFGNRQATQDALEASAPAYAWGLFLALNRPLDGSGSRVWETTFRQTSSIYLPDGSPPAPWGEDGPPPEVTAAASSMDATLMPDDASGCSAASPVWHNLDTAIQVDGLALLDRWNQDVRYQLLMNQPAFDYVVERAFYNLNGQTRAASEGKPASFPADAFELKTSWIWLGQDAARCAELGNQYYVARAYYQKVDADGRPAGWETGYAALSGFHVINRALPDWVWITFENVHNPDFTQVRHELPIAQEVQDANKAFQAALLGIGSIFANYELDGVQTTFTDADGAAVLLANTNIESAFQSQSSCMTCHALASIKPDGEYFNLVDTTGGNVAYYVGDPPDVTAAGFTSLDFVWSMKRASWYRGGASS